MSSTQDFTCVFCSETFEDKESLQEHFRKHGDPKFNVTKNKSRFENESSVGSEKSEENEMVGCDVCDETFKTISKAITHKHKVHPDHDAKHFCPWCGKLFTMKHLYNKHMQTTHVNMFGLEESDYHCDSCGVDFFVPSAMMYHNKFFHRQDSEIPSIGHSKKVKTFNQELVQIFYCPFCGEEYNNKVNLHKHMTDDHSDENQSPDEVLRCPLCDAVFYHLDAYELHLSFHSIDDIYSDDSEMATAITDFSLESVPPIMEKVEEETKNDDNQGIDKFLQLVMGDARENGNKDGLDKPKSKKHKKHKKSKKAAITLDEFLNMNKDVFGDGLDIQGIEEVPTQHVLKKYMGKKDNVAKAIPTSAIAKLKKQGITVKSNSSPNSPTFKTNRTIINKAHRVPNRIPVIGADKPKTVTTSNELLSKLLNQGNNQIKIVKKTSLENFNKDNLYRQADIQEPASSNINSKQYVSDQVLSSPKSDEEVKGETKNLEMEQDNSADEANQETSCKELSTDGEFSNKKEEEVNANLLPQETNNTKINNNGDNHANIMNYDDSNDINIETPEITKRVSETPDNSQKVHQPEVHESDINESFETNGEDMENIASDEEEYNTMEDKCKKSLNEVSQKESDNTLQRPNNKPLDALKHLSGLITVKPAYSTEDKKHVMETTNKNEDEDAEENDTDVQLKVAKLLGKNIQNLSVKNKKPTIPQKVLNTPTKSIDALKTLNKQLTISPCVTSTTKSNNESEEDESDNSHDNLDYSDKNTTSEKDNSNFKTPISATKQLNTTKKPNHLMDAKTPVHIKNSSKGFIKEEENPKNCFNMDILKRLTNVTAKPIAKAMNSPQVSGNRYADSRMLVLPPVERNKQIDQDIEIFNIDDSDSDQESPNEESIVKLTENTVPSSDTNTTSANVLKNLSKNITIKATNHNRNVNIKKEIPSDSPRQISEEDIQSTSNIESKNIPLNMKGNLNHALKKLGNNISIKSQYTPTDSQRYHMSQDEENIDDNFEMNDEGSDVENAKRVKITEVQENEENFPSDTDMEYDENVIVQSPHASNSENEEEESHDFQSDEERVDDIEKQIKTTTLLKENSPSQCLDNFKRNNKELTIKSLNDKSTLQQTGPPRKKQGEAIRLTNKVCKDMSVKQFRTAERQDEDSEVLTKNQSSATTSSSQKVSNQVNTVKTVKTFQSETIIEEITTTVTKTIRTVNQSSKQLAKNVNTTYRPRLMIPNQQAKPLQGITVRNAPTVGTKIRNAAPSLRQPTIRPTKTIGQIVPVRPQNQLVPRQQGVFRPNAPGPSNIKKMSPQPNQKPVIGKPLKISPLAMNQTVKRAPETVTGHISSFKKPKDLMVPAMDAFDDDNDDSMVNYSSTSSCRSDFSTTATKIVKGKSVVTATQAKSEQHSEQHITKLNNMAGLKIVRTSTKQASQVQETKNNMCAAKRTTMDAIEKLQKQGLLIKKPRIETPEEDDHYNTDSEGDEEEYEEND